MGTVKKVYKIEKESGLIVRSYPTLKRAYEIEKIPRSTLSRVCIEKDCINGFIYSYDKPTSPDEARSWKSKEVKVYTQPKPAEDTQFTLRKLICATLKLEPAKIIIWNSSNYQLNENYYLQPGNINPAKLLDESFTILEKVRLGSLAICNVKSDEGIRVLYDYFIRVSNDKSTNITIHSTLDELLDSWYEQHKDKAIYEILKNRLNRSVLPE